ncbi:MAG: hypothetical protein ABSD58_03170 [Verrucomicrobiia bacterium]|jgi:hypothetical protein
MSNRLPYFHTPERIAALKDQLAKWQTTRWRHSGTHPNEMRCGISGDCLFWVVAFKAIGALPQHLVIPDYRKMEAAGDKMALLRLRIMETGRAEMVMEEPTPASPPARGPKGWVNAGLQNIAQALSPPGRGPKGWVPMAGDVLLFRNGMSGVHCGLVIRPAPMHFFHLSQNGALEEPFNQSHWLASLAFVYRLMEEQPTPSASLLPLQGGDKEVGVA